MEVNNQVKTYLLSLSKINIVHRESMGFNFYLLVGLVLILIPVQSATQCHDIEDANSPEVW